MDGNPSRIVHLKGMLKSLWIILTAWICVHCAVACRVGSEDTVKVRVEVNNLQQNQVQVEIPFNGEPVIPQESSMWIGHLFTTFN